MIFFNHERHEKARKFLKVVALVHETAPQNLILVPSTICGNFPPCEVVSEGNMERRRLAGRRHRGSLSWPKNRGAYGVRWLATALKAGASSRTPYLLFPIKKSF